MALNREEILAGLSWEDEEDPVFDDEDDNGPRLIVLVSDDTAVPFSLN